MNAEQAKRARIAVGVPSGYGLGAGLWTLAPITQDPDFPRFVVGLALMFPTFFGVFVLYVVAYMIASWIAGRDLDWPVFR